MKKNKENKRWGSYPPFINGPEKEKKPLKREDFPNLTDEQFEMVQEVYNTPGEGPS